MEKNSQAINKFKTQAAIMEKLQLSNSQLIELVDTKTFKINELESKISELESAYAAVSDKDNQVAELKANFKVQIDELKENIKKLNNELVESKKNIEEDQLKHDQTVEHMGQQIEELQFSIRDRDEKLSRIQTKLDVLVEWFNNSRDTEQKVEIVDKSLQKEDLLKPDLSALGEIDHPVAVSIEMLKQSIEDNRVEISKLQSASVVGDTAKAENEDLKATLEKNGGELQRLRGEMELIADKNEKLSAVCEEFERKQCDMEQ